MKLNFAAAVRAIAFSAFLFPVQALAQCPGEDAEPAMTVKVKNGTTLFVCGFEDREVPGTKGKRAFSDFAVYYELGAKDEAGDKSGAGKIAPPTAAANGASTSFDSLKAFASDPNETYWIKAIPGKGLEMEELWFFSEKPTPALKQEITCTADACTASPQKCILKMKANSFPKALPEFRKRAAAGTLTDDGEELIDQIFVQAFLGDRAAKEFYTNQPANLDPALIEAFTANKKKLEVGCKK